MPRTTPKPADGLSKFQRYRKLQARKGMRLLRVWVQDRKRSDFAREAERQAKLLHNRPDEVEALDFIAYAL
jgi:hypothetical protein